MNIKKHLPTIVLLALIGGLQASLAGLMLGAVITCSADDAKPISKAISEGNLTSYKGGLFWCESETAKWTDLWEGRKP